MDDKKDLAKEENAQKHKDVFEALFGAQSPYSGLGNNPNNPGARVPQAQHPQPMHQHPQTMHPHAQPIYHPQQNPYAARPVSQMYGNPHIPQQNPTAQPMHQTQPMPYVAKPLAHPIQNPPIHDLNAPSDKDPMILPKTIAPNKIPVSGYPPGYNPPSHIPPHAHNIPQYAPSILQTSNIAIPYHPQNIPVGYPPNITGVGVSHKYQAPMEMTLQCTLEELYKGELKKLVFTRKIVDDEGNLAYEEKEIPVQLLPGWKGGTRVRFDGDGDKLSNEPPRDVMCTIVEMNHPVFARNGNNLICKKDISLLEALSGFTFRVTLLNGEEFVDKIDHIIYPGDTKIYEKKGYKSQRDSSLGDLVVQFNTIWPKHLTHEQKEQLKIGPLSQCPYIDNNVNSEENSSSSE